MAVNTSITDVNEFLDHIVSSTNMRCLTPPIALNGACGFLAANLYAKSAFGEDALVNVSIEKAQNGKLAGNIRIRCAKSLPLSASCIITRVKKLAVTFTYYNRGDRTFFVDLTADQTCFALPSASGLGL